MKMQSEPKHVDTFLSIQPIDTTGNIECLNPLSIGATEGQRIGDEVQCTSLQLRVHFVTTNTLLSATEVRHCIVWDKQHNNAVGLTAGQLFDVSVITDLLHAPHNHAYIERFKFLYDERFVLQPYGTQNFAPATGAATAFINSAQVRTIFKKLGRGVKFSTNNGDDTDIVTNALYYVVFGPNAPSVNNPTFTMGCRVYYKDT